MIAVIMARKSGIIPLHIRANCMMTIDGNNSDKQWRLRSRRPSGSFWRASWRALENHGCQSDHLTSAYVKGHRLCAGLLSAGARVFVRTHVPTTVLVGLGGVAGFEILMAWSVILRVDVGVPGGLLLGPCYAVSTSAGDCASVDFDACHKLVDHLGHFSRPFVIAGD